MRGTACQVIGSTDVNTTGKISTFMAITDQQGRTMEQIQMLLLLHTHTINNYKWTSLWCDEKEDLSSYCKHNGGGWGERRPWAWLSRCGIYCASMRTRVQAKRWNACGLEGRPRMSPNTDFRSSYGFGHMYTLYPYTHAYTHVKMQKEDREALYDYRNMQLLCIFMKFVC